MFAEIFGSVTAGRVLVFVARRGEGYTREIAAAFEISPQMVHEQLSRFERSGLMTSRRLGSLRLFSFDPSHPLAEELGVLLAKCFESLGSQDRQRITGERSSPKTRSGRPSEPVERTQTTEDAEELEDRVRLL